MSIGLILDTSALLAHIRLERVSVGELIGEVADNGDVTGLPALSVLEALAVLDGADRVRLQRLISEPSHTVIVLPLVADDLIDVDRIAGLIAGGRGDAHAVVEANKHAVMLATTRPGMLGIGVVIHPDDVGELS